MLQHSDKGISEHSASMMDLVPIYGIQLDESNITPLLATQNKLTHRLARAKKLFVFVAGLVIVMNSTLAFQAVPSISSRPTLA